ncbi:MAG: hypothetical protein O2955_20945, partial [Planctomycetota bacterium]|nr:hypothetical protein [Planctomycetota bacterium]
RMEQRLSAPNPHRLRKLVSAGPGLVPQSIDVWGRVRLTQLECRQLTNMIGECRIICLCSTPTSTVQSRQRLRLKLTRFVGARIMAVTVVPERKIQIVLQPAIVVTKTALLATLPGDEATSSIPANPYIYKIQVTQ